MKYLVALLALPIGVFGKIETWTNLEGKSMEAELVAANDKQATFRKADGSTFVYERAKLAQTDQARVAEAASKLPPAPTPSAPPKVGTLTAEIAGKLVSIKGSSLTPHAREKILGSKYYAIYYSAHWCPPCRGFTPELVDAYKELKAKQPGFEVVFVSSDEDTDAMKGYMIEYKMPWPAVRFDSTKSLRAIQRYAENGIPNLVFVSADGEVLSSSYVDGKYVGPRKVLADIRKTLSSDG